MAISRTLLVSVVFLVILKESSSYHHQIHKGNHLLIRNRRNHESDHDLFLRTKQNINNYEENNGLTEKVNQTNTLKDKDRFSKNLGQNPVKTFILPGKIIKMRSPHVKNNNNNIDSINKSNVAVKNNADLVHKHDDDLLIKENDDDFLVNTNNDQNKVSETLLNRTKVVDNVVEKKNIAEEVVAEITVNKTLSSNSENKSYENTEHHIKETVNLEYEKPQILKMSTKPKPKELKTRKPYDTMIDDKINYETSVVKQVSDRHLKNKTIDTPLVKPDIALEKHKTECDEENLEDESVDAFIEKEQKIKSVHPGVINCYDDELLPKRHPIFNVIQNDCIMSPITKVEVNSMNEDNVAKTANDDAFDSVKKQLKIEGNNDDDDGVIVKDKNFKEVIEIMRTPTFMRSKAPVSYRVPYNSQGVSKTELNDNKPWDAHEQRIDQIDGTTVVSYNNYFKMPANSNWNVNKNRYYPYNFNNYNMYGYQGYGRPNMSRYNWNNNYYRPNGNVTERVWRSWRNTEYILKSKNALKKIGNSNNYNLVNQNNIADKTRNMQRQNALDRYGYYRNQNILPYL